MIIVEKCVSVQALKTFTAYICRFKVDNFLGYLEKNYFLYAVWEKRCLAVCGCTFFCVCECIA